MRTGTAAFLIGIIIFQQLTALPELKWAGLLPLLVFVAFWLPRLRPISATVNSNPLILSSPGLYLAGLRLFILCSTGFLWALLYVSFVYSTTLKPEL